MLNWIKSTILAAKQPREHPATPPPPDLMDKSLLENLIYLRQQLNGAADLVIREFTLHGYRGAVCSIDNLVDKQLVAESIFNPIHQIEKIVSDETDLYTIIRDKALSTMEMMEIHDNGRMLDLIMSGFVGIYIDGVDKAIMVGVQGFPVRGVDEPATEVMERGSREGFVEVLRFNMAMVRRRLKTSSLRFDVMQIGERSKTDVCVCYLNDSVSPRMLENVKSRLASIKLDTVMEAGYLQPFLEDKPLSLFSSVGMTERPDTLISKISEGRIAIMVDGTPNALIVPSMFIEEFQNLDDYSNRPYYATLMRWIKYVSFLVAILLPGTYVAIATFHQDLFPQTLLAIMMNAEIATPFSFMVEALIIHILYEIMREAGLRLPRPVGHAVSIVGALVVGQAAVTAGLIGAPMVMIIALTSISSYVIPKLYSPIAFLRFGFILVGGTLGLYGIALFAGVIVVNICSLNSFGVPYSSGVSPLDKNALRDVFIRASWLTLSKKSAKVQNLHGSDEEGEESN